MAIDRGQGIATTLNNAESFDFGSVLDDATAAKVAAELAQTAAELAETNAELAETNAETSETNAASTASGVVVSVAEAAASALAAQSSEDDAAIDLGLTNANVVLTNADVVLTNADVVLTAADVISAEADKVQTGLDRIATAADKVVTNADVVLTNADVVSAEADKVQTGLDRTATAADKVATNADAVLTAADVVLAEADKVASAASASTATTQAGISTTKAGEAATSASSASTSASTATTQAALATTNGAAQVTLATAQTTLATTAKTAAETAETNAETAETNASASATASASSATASATSASSAASAATTAVNNVIDSAPANLDTLNELAAALGDDANFSTTVTNNIATKLPLAGGTMTGAIAMGANKVTGVTDPTAAQDAATKAYVDASGGGGVSDIVEDTTPQLGGTLDTNGNNISFGDNVKANFGADDDLQIYHDGSNSYIDDSGTGDLLIRASDQIALSNADNSEYYAIFDENGACGFRYNNSTKLATTSTGIDVTGVITSDLLTETSTGLGIGTSSPSSKLHIKSASDAIARFEQTGGGWSYLEFASDSTRKGFFGLDSVGNFHFGSDDSKGLQFYSGGSYRLVVTADGTIDFGGNSLRNVRDWKYTSSANSGAQYVHMKTNRAPSAESQMYSVTFRGHSYGDTDAVNTNLSWYNYGGSTVGQSGSNGTHTASVYKSTDGYAVMTLYIPAHYYLAFTYDQFTTNQGLKELTITASTTSSSSTGAY